MKKKVFNVSIESPPRAIDEMLGENLRSGMSVVPVGDSGLGSSTGTEFKRRGPRPYTEPWVRTTFCISVRHKAALDELIERRKVSGDFRFSARVAIERAIDLLIKEYERKGQD